MTAESEIDFLPSDEVFSWQNPTNPMPQIQPFNALHYLLGLPSNQQVIHESDASSGLLPIPYNQSLGPIMLKPSGSLMNNDQSSEPEVPNNVDLNCLDDILHGVVNRPMDELDQLLMEAGIEIGKSVNINCPVTDQDGTQTAPPSDFDPSEPHSQPQLQMPSSDDIALLQLETNSSGTIMQGKPMVTVEPNPHTVNQKQVTRRRKTSVSRLEPFQPIVNDSTSSLSPESPDVLSHADRRNRNHRRNQKRYTSRISNYFSKIKGLLSLKKSTSYTACLDKVTTRLRYIGSLEEEASVREKLYISLQEDNKQLRHELTRLKARNLGS